MSLEIAFDASPGRLAAIAERVEAARVADGARAAVTTFIADVGVRVPLGDDASFKAEADYYLGLLFAKVGQPRRAIEYIDQSGALPGSGGEQLFADHVRQSIEMHERRLAAQARGMPTFLVAALPRSASATLTQTIATMLDLPIFRISLSRWLVPRWLDTISPGGAMLHDHFHAHPENIEVLRAGGVRDVFVLIRDPRASAASAFFHRERRDASVVDTVAIEREISEIFVKHADWVQSWIDLAARTDVSIRVRWIQSTDVRTNIGRVWDDLVAVLGPDYPAIRAFDGKMLPLIKANFVKGDDESWRRSVGPDTQLKMWSSLSPSARSLLDLRP